MRKAKQNFAEEEGKKYSTGRGRARNLAKEAKRTEFLENHPVMN